MKKNIFFISLTISLITTSLVVAQTKEMCLSRLGGKVWVVDWASNEIILRFNFPKPPPIGDENVLYFVVEKKNYDNKLSTSIDTTNSSTWYGIDSGMGWHAVKNQAMFFVNQKKIYGLLPSGDLVSKINNYNNIEACLIIKINEGVMAKNGGVGWVGNDFATGIKFDSQGYIMKNNNPYNNIVDTEFVDGVFDFYFIHEYHISKAKNSLNVDQKFIAGEVEGSRIRVNTYKETYVNPIAPNGLRIGRYHPPIANEYSYLLYPSAKQFCLERDYGNYSIQAASIYKSGAFGWWENGSWRGSGGSPFVQLDRLKCFSPTQIDNSLFNNSFLMIQAVDLKSNILSSYPNPFNPQTNIQYFVNIAGPVRVEVFDVLGRSVRLLTQGEYEVGSHQIQFDGSGLPSGSYYVKFVSVEGSHTIKINLLK